MKKTIIFSSLLAIIFIFSQGVQSQKFSFPVNNMETGLSLESETSENIIINHSIPEVYFEDVDINGEMMKSVKMPGQFLSNDEGAPDLPGSGRYVIIPQGANVSVTVLASKSEVFKNQDISPAARIPLDTDNGPLHYEKNSLIYSKDQFYPQEPVTVSGISKIRGVDVVMLGVTPFQYNPVTKELIVYYELKIKISMNGGTGLVGENRLRSRWWDTIIKDAVINPNALPSMDYSKKPAPTDTPDYEYLIIVPNDPIFISWADSVKLWRNLQGIHTGVVTTAAIGGNTTTAIETYVNNAYNTWAVPPVAVLLIGDYGTTGSTIVSPIWGSYCVSDNIYADVDNDDLPEMIFARMTAQNATHLETMITKFLDYERTPPTNAGYYNNPITACGWQTDRWFQLCSEIVGGFWKYELGKTPVRINEIYSGTPGTTWSTTTYGDTPGVVNYFGPSGLGYIPASPSTLGGWSGGNASMINAAINNGAFMLQHRDHGGETGWGEPAYSSSNIDGLTNTDLVWVFSINCLTGKYNYSSEVFAEKFHRYKYGGQNSGALGITAASEVSYSFVNDCFVWGMFDNMWPDFMPTYGTNPPSRDILPSFGMAAGKYFLAQTGWPYNTDNKVVTYHLFHHHGDAFTTVYTEMPQYLTVTHAAALLSGTTSFSVTANAGSFIALTVNGAIIGTVEGTGSPVNISIPAQNPGDVMVVTVTKQNYYRYSSAVDIIPPTGPFVSYSSHTINDVSGNNNGQADYGEILLLNMTLENLGSAAAYNVNATLSSSDSYVTISDNFQNFGTILSGAASTQNNAFGLTISNSIPDQYSISFELQVNGNADETWISYFTILVNAPVLEAGTMTIDDGAGGNGLLDPGETADIIIQTSNTGHSLSPVANATLACASPYITVVNGNYSFGQISAGSTESATFTVSASASTPVGTGINLNYQVSAGSYSDSETYGAVVGQTPVLILDLDPNHSSGTQMGTAMTSLAVAYDYLTSFPADLNIYTSVFVCLGIYSSNHVLTTSEGQVLANYLTNGGLLYMEGGDTWYYDASTPVHSMFNIDGQADGTSDMGTILGQNGSFTAGMTFSYSGENSWMDHIGPIAPAVQIFMNQSPSYGCAVAYDAVTYRTIGSSFEFGGLTDGASPSTKEELMNQYLTFFGITGNPPLPPDIEVTPLSFNVTLSPDETKTETLTISNQGELGLNFSIAVVPADAASGKLSQYLSQEQKASFRSQPEISNQFDELTSGSPNPDILVLPPVNLYGSDDSKGEETFGSWSGGTWSGGLRDRGNIYSVTTSTILTEMRFYLGITSSTSLYFFVYQGSAATGTYTKIAESYIPASGTGTGWYSSGSMNVSLNSGSYYYIGTSWNGTATYGRGTEVVPIATTFGNLISGVPATIAGYPPATTCNNTYTTNSPYYQTLVTSSTPPLNWLSVNPATGTVSGLDTYNVDVLFDATGLAEGTYEKDLVISSNDPDEPQVIIPCTLQVVQGTTVSLTAMLQGPFETTQMNNALNTLGYIPLTQPYNVSPWYYTGSETVLSIPSVSVVDWCLVELRETPGDVTTATPSTIISRQAGFIHSNGQITGLDGTTPLVFELTVTQNLYAIVYHRNHLGIMSSIALSQSGDDYIYDFTTSAEQVYGGSLAQTELGSGIWGMTSGDGQCDGQLNNSDKNEVWKIQNGNTGYLTGDLNLDGTVDITDKTNYWKPNAGKCSFIVK